MRINAEYFSYYRGLVYSDRHLAAELMCPCAVGIMIHGCPNKNYSASDRIQSTLSSLMGSHQCKVEYQDLDKKERLQLVVDNQGA
jgi:hypothetical protein